jgi:hypothetical protein
MRKYSFNRNILGITSGEEWQIDTCTFCDKILIYVYIQSIEAQFILNLLLQCDCRYTVGVIVHFIILLFIYITN